PGQRILTVLAVPRRQRERDGGHAVLVRAREDRSLVAGQWDDDRELAHRDPVEVVKDPAVGQLDVLAAGGEPGAPVEMDAPREGPPGLDHATRNFSSFCRSTVRPRTGFVGNARRTSFGLCCGS